MVSACRLSHAIETQVVDRCTERSELCLHLRRLHSALGRAIEVLSLAKTVPGPDEYACQSRAREKRYSLDPLIESKHAVPTERSVPCVPVNVTVVHCPCEGVSARH